MNPKPKKIHGWIGVELSSNELTVGLTPCIGGRIMSLQYQGQELLFIDNERKAEVFDPKQWQDLITAKKALGFRVWGGDKTWIAPQSAWLAKTPPLDLDAAPYDLTWSKSEAVMTSPICRETGLQIIRHVGLNQNKVHLVEEIYNRTNKPIEKGLWNVTQIKRPCRFEIPAQSWTFRSYHQEDITLLPYGGDLAPHDGYLKVDCRGRDLFKIGGMPRINEVTIRIPGIQQDICWTKTFNFDPGAKYAHKSAVEIFNSPQYPYAEIELHAPLTTLSPGQCARLEQTWQISACSSN